MIIASRGHVQLIVGLGNPGIQYELTRHNTGARLVRRIAGIYGADLCLESKFHGLVGDIKVGGSRSSVADDVARFCKLLMPTTFMNHSGRAVWAVANFYKIPVVNILIVHDELDFPCGVARLKFDGGHNGHNGIRDIIAVLGDGKFHRARIGISRPVNAAQNISGYVLDQPSKSERVQIDAAIDEIIPRILEL